MNVRRVALGLAILGLVSAAVASRAGASPVLSTIPLRAVPAAIAVDARTGRAFVVNNGDDSISVLDTHADALVRTVAVGQGPTAVAVDERAGRIIVTDAATRVEALGGQFVSFLLAIGAPRDVSLLDATNGHLVRRIPAAVSPLPPVVDARRDRAIVATYADDGLDSERVQVLATANGRLVRSLTMGGITLAATTDNRASRLILVRTSIGFDGRPGDATVDVLDADSGRAVRHSAIGGLPVPDALAVDEIIGHAFMLTADKAANRGAIVMIDTRSGRLLRRTLLPGTPTAVALDTRMGHAFVSMQGPAAPSLGMTSLARSSTELGRVAVVDARSGALLRTVGVGVAPAAMAVDSRRGRVFVVNAGGADRLGNPTEPGTVSVLDARSGVVLQTVTVGPDPVGIAVDERVGRAFVVSVGGALRVTDAWGWLPPGLRRWTRFLLPPGPRMRTVPSTVSILDTAR